MAKNLVIVESPAKAKTISKFLGSDYVIKASMGHIRDLPAKSLGVDIKGNYEPVYETSSDKKKIVKELRELADKAELVWLATDEDREGEAISWHLLKTLGLDENRVNRIVFHEITKPAILAAIENPRKIDMNLVDAQQARRILDRLVGFELSPLLWRKVMPKLSAGRVQSVATRLIVDKENEIKDFQETNSYKINADFQVKDSVLKAEVPDNINDKDSAAKFLNDCIPAAYIVNNIEKRPGKKVPPPPFTTSTLQQDASRKLGFTVAKTMLVAQQLYESGKITYMRTDSVTLSELAMNTIKKEIIDDFGSRYYKRRMYKTKTKGAQEAHEAIRPTFASEREVEGTNDQQRLYKLIWKRTVASQMSDAVMEKTIVTIDISTRPEKLVANAEIITFPGFLKVYESSDSESNEVQTIPPLNEGEVLDLIKMTATQKFTQPPLRYNEAMLVRKLEELGIGRPSTYAPIISTIQKRKYVEKLNKPALTRQIFILELAKGKVTEKSKSEKHGAQKGKLFPTDIGGVVNDFLMKYFLEIIDYNFTALVVEEFDKVANGELEWKTMIDHFYVSFHKQVELTGKESEKFSGENYLGEDPATGRKVVARLGRYGPMIQIGDKDDEDKPRFASLPKNRSLEEITLKEALKLFEFPKLLGEYNDQEVFLATGRFGPYIKSGKNNYSLDKKVKLDDVDLEFALELMKQQDEEKKNRIIKEFSEDDKLKVLKGKWGPYLTFGRKNYKIPAEYDPENLSYEDCRKIISAAPDPRKKKSRKT
ncbi:MAG: type I DNA topoisomerase [Candidatus Cloacimonetes bacterium]|nr:type I DNA topoisomerase [Candidatus Cloacimonadota bacterium]